MTIGEKHQVGVGRLGKPWGNVRQPLHLGSRSFPEKLIAAIHKELAAALVRPCEIQQVAGVQQLHDLQRGDESWGIMIGCVLMSPHLDHDVERHAQHVLEAATLTTKLTTRRLFSNILRMSGVPGV